MRTIRESNYAVLKQPRNRNSKAERCWLLYQAQPMRWMHLMILTQIIHS